VDDLQLAVRDAGTPGGADPPVRVRQLGGLALTIGAWAFGLLSTLYFIAFLVVSLGLSVILSIAAVAVDELNYRTYRSLRIVDGVLRVGDARPRVLDVRDRARDRLVEQALRLRIDAAGLGRLQQRHGFWSARSASSRRGSAARAMPIQTHSATAATNTAPSGSNLRTPLVRVTDVCFIVPRVPQLMDTRLG
jgi:hypothetical protein